MFIVNKKIISKENNTEEYDIWLRTTLDDGTAYIPSCFMYCGGNLFLKVYPKTKPDIRRDTEWTIGKYGKDY